jgi:hypothetical protein
MTQGHIDVGQSRDGLALVEACVARGVPLLGVCRGFQKMNVAFGISARNFSVGTPCDQSDAVAPSGSRELRKRCFKSESAASDATKRNGTSSCGLAQAERTKAGADIQSRLRCHRPRIDAISGFDLAHLDEIPVLSCGSSGNGPIFQLICRNARAGHQFRTHSARILPGAPECLERETVKMRNDPNIMRST